MNEIHIILTIYLIAINIATFFVYGIDKWKARRSRWRIPESTLLTLAVLGGSIGAFIGMRTCHHKTMHDKLKYGVPLIMNLQVVLAVYIYIRFH